MTAAMSLNSYSIAGLVSRLKNIPALRGLEPVSLLRDIDFFSGVEPSILGELSGRILVSEFGKDDLICRHGMFDERFYVILAGTVRAVIPTEENPAYRLFGLGPGGFFGEEIIYTSEPRESTIVADDYLFTLSMDAATLRLLVESSTRIRSLMEKSYIDRQLRSDLRRVPVFTNLHDRIFEEVLSRVTLLSLPPDSVICTEGETGDAFYLIRDGEVNVYRRHEEKLRLVAILGDGQFFGEMSLLSDERRNATVVTSKALRHREDIERGLPPDREERRGDAEGAHHRRRRAAYPPA